MSTYVMSDIHGHYDEFIEMMELIKFSNKDKLFIIGDIIDRGPKSLQMIEYVRSHDNVIMLLGNHELMMYDYFRQKSAMNRNVWYSNGGRVTHNDIIASVSEDKLDALEQELLGWSGKLPLILEVEIGDIRYVLCHADPFVERKDEMVWNRIYPDERIYRDPESNVIFITGHTPVTCFIPSKEPAKLLKNDSGNLWYIDGGAAYPQDDNSRLICLRLEDEKEYYVRVLK